MKHILLSLLGLWSISSALADDDIHFLRFRLTDGSTRAFVACAQTVRVSGGAFVITDGTSVSTLPAAQVAGLELVSLGDANGDGRIDVADIADVVGHSSRVSTSRADINGNGRLDATDVDLTARHILSLQAGSRVQAVSVLSHGVAYRLPVAEATSLAVTGGSTLTAAGRTFALADVSGISVDHEAVADSTVTVRYAGGEVLVGVSVDCMDWLTVSVAGTHVEVKQAEGLTRELTYVLSGASTDGSFTMDGKYKATVVFSGLDLTATACAPVNIKNGKRIDLILEGDNRLSDTSASTDKGALMVKGHAELSGDGTLTLSGHAKHAFWAGEYVKLKKSLTGTVNVVHAEGDGLHVTQHYEQNGGTLRIAGVGDDGLQVEADYITPEGQTVQVVDPDEAGYVDIAGGVVDIVTTTDDVKCLSAAGDITISGGHVTLSAEGVGSRAVKSDASVSIVGGEVVATTSGPELETTVGAEVDVTHPRAVQAELTLTVSGGILRAASAYDDALYSKQDILLTGGTVAAWAPQGRGLQVKNGSLLTNGATLLSVGRKALKRAATSTSPVVTASGLTVSAGQTATLRTATQILCSLQVPAGPASTTGQIVQLSSPRITVGTSYNITLGTASVSAIATK